LARYRLRFLDREIDLPQGEFVIGRAPACQLCIDDPVVSRRHARILVGPEGATLEDMGSRNGLFLNGVPVRAANPLARGDKLRIGEIEMTLVCLTDEVTDTMDALQPVVVRMPLTGEAGPGVLESTQSSTGSSWLLLEVAEKSLAMGRIEDAEWIVAKFAEDIDQRLRDGHRVPPETIDRTTVQALKLATATSNADWLEWIFHLYRDARRVLPGEAIEELHRVVRRLRYPVTPALLGYVETLREMSPSLKPAERFLLQRMEGLLEVAASN
jgi:pSer/pThr/pTyr-binding forkhead associated (FHA) protein